MMWSVLPVAILVTILTGCAGVKTSNMVPGFGSRVPPTVGPHQEIILQEHPTRAVTSFFGKDGFAHVFTLNQSGDIRHIVVSASQVVKRESIGTAEGVTDSKGNPTEQLSIDAIEHPKGTLRVAVNGVQYVQRDPGTDWQKVENSRCSRYLAFRERLLCAFIAKGDEIGSPTRKDTTVGLLVILPIWSSTEKQSDKLVLSEEQEGVWSVRAIIDPEDPFDIDADFFSGIDDMGTIHFLYAGSRGGGFWGIGGGGGFSIGAPSTMRFTQVSVDRLFEQASTASTGALSGQQPANPLIINGLTPKKMPFLEHRHRGLVENPDAWFELRPFSQQFSLDAPSGEIRGVMWAHRVGLDDGEHKVMFDAPGDFPRLGLESNWVSVSLRDGKWVNRFDVVTGDGIPEGSLWQQYPEAFARVDPHGWLHLLLIDRVMEKNSILGRYSCSIAYLTESSTGWSAPLTLGSCPLSSVQRLAGDAGRSLAFAEDGRVFASWIDKDGALVGRFLSPIASKTGIVKRRV